MFLRTLRKTRYSLMLISLLLSLWWLCSVLTGHLRHVWLASVLCILCPALALSVLALRGLLDYQVSPDCECINTTTNNVQVINRIKRAYLKNKVSSVSVTYEDSKVIPSRKTTYNSPRVHKKSYQVNANPDPLHEGDEYL